MEIHMLWFVLPYEERKSPTLKDADLNTWYGWHFCYDQRCMSPLKLPFGLIWCFPSVTACSFFSPAMHSLSDENEKSTVFTIYSTLRTKEFVYIIVIKFAESSAKKQVIYYVTVNLF